MNAFNLPYSESQINELVEDVYQNSLSHFESSVPSELLAVYVDGYHVNIKNDKGKFIKSVVYCAISLDLDCNKDVIAVWIADGSENLDKWKEFLTSLVNRGLTKPLFILSDDFSGLKEAINVIFPKTFHQLCLVHFLRNLRKRMTKDQYSEFVSEFRNLRDSSDSKDNIIERFVTLCEIYITEIEYRNLVISKTDQYFAFLNVDKSVRKFFTSTNAVESFNSILERRRVISGYNFQSKRNLFVNIFLLRENLLLKKCHEVIPLGEISKF